MHSWAYLKTQDFCSDSRRSAFGGLNRSLPDVNEDLKISDNAEDEQKDKFLEVPSCLITLYCLLLNYFPSPRHDA